jgi:hypothetical protein
MTALYVASAQRDPIGEAVRWVAAQSPSAESWLDAHCPTGTFGPVPLGLAAAGVVALVSLAATLYLLAATIVMLVVVLYAVPRIVGRLTGEADQQRRVVRASGPAELRSFAFGGEVVAADQAAFRLTPEQYARLVSRARALVVHHTLDLVTVAYLPASNTLLDVRDADGAVLIRNPEYAGEPGDVLAFPAEQAPPEPAPTVSRIGEALTMTLPVPPALRAAVQAGRRRANLWLVGVLAYGIVMLFVVTSFKLAGLLVALIWFSYLFYVVWKLGGFLNQRALGNATSLVRIVGPVSLIHVSSGRTGAWRLVPEDGVLIDLDEKTYNRLTAYGEQQNRLRDPWARLKRDPNERVYSVYLIPSAAVAYVPGIRSLVQVTIGKEGEAKEAEVYRVPSLANVDLTLPPVEV